MRRFISIPLTALVILIALAACGVPNSANIPGSVKASAEVSAPGTGENAAGVSTVYEYVLEQWRTAMDSGFQSLPELIIDSPELRMDRSIVYAYRDIDNNGTPELIIAFSDGDGIGQQTILDIYAYDGQKAVRLFAGSQDEGFWTRNSCNPANENMLAVQSSGGADTFSVTLYKINTDGYTVTASDIFGCLGGLYYLGIPPKETDQSTVSDLISYWISGLSLDLLAEIDWQPLSLGGALAPA